MAQPPKKPVVKKPTPKPAEPKLPPMTQASMDAASKMDAEDYKSMKTVKKAKGGKVNTCKMKCGGKVKKK